MKNKSFILLIFQLISFFLFAQENVSVNNISPEHGISDFTASIILNNSVHYDFSFVYVQGGTFFMGSKKSDDEYPVHEVALDGFYMTKYEITNKQFCAFLNEKGNRVEGGVSWIDLSGIYKIETCRISEIEGQYVVEPGYEDRAVIYVSWYGARAYCEWMSEQLGKVVRLPTEAEWEYAARGGIYSKDYKYSGSNKLNEVAWWHKRKETKAMVQDVGKNKANELGIYDMSGNVWEWCSDWYDPDYYSNCPWRNPSVSGNGKVKVLRGGSWINQASYCRVTNRFHRSPDGRDGDIGFRIVLSQDH